MKKLSIAARIFGRHSRALCHQGEKRRLRARPDSTVSRREQPSSPSRARRHGVAAAAASSRPTDLLEERGGERVTTGDTLALKAKTRGPSRPPKTARPNIITPRSRAGDAKGKRRAPPAASSSVAAAVHHEGISRERLTHNSNQPHKNKPSRKKRESEESRPERLADHLSRTV